MSRPHALLKAFRLIHLYIGVFITPALIFFAFTGALQTFGLHESSQGSSYKPSAWVVTLAQIHKKQTPVVPVRRPFPRPPASLADHPAAISAISASAPAVPARTHHPLPMKIFFLLVSIGLFISSLTGIYMAWKYTRNRIAIALVLLAGIIVPPVLLLI
jgi:uncharacterized iron-regulated membrane protein